VKIKPHKHKQYDKNHELFLPSGKSQTTENFRSPVEHKNIFSIKRNAKSNAKNAMPEYGK